MPKQDINGEWQQKKTSIVDAARDVIRTQGKPQRNEWWDEECKKIIQEKNLWCYRLINVTDFTKIKIINLSHLTSRRRGRYLEGM